MQNLGQRTSFDSRIYLNAEPHMIMDAQLGYHWFRNNVECWHSFSTTEVPHNLISDFIASDVLDVKSHITIALFCLRWLYS